MIHFPSESRIEIPLTWNATTFQIVLSRFCWPQPTHGQRISCHHQIFDNVVEEREETNKQART